MNQKRQNCMSVKMVFRTCQFFRYVKVKKSLNLFYFTLLICQRLASGCNLKIACFVKPIQGLGYFMYVHCGEVEQNYPKNNPNYPKGDKLISHKTCQNTLPL